MTKFKHEDGKQDVVIEDGLGLPACLHLSMYLANNYLKSALNTRVTYAHTLAFILRYFNRVGIDLPLRVETGGSLTEEELQGFFKHCSFTADSAFASDNDSNVTSFARFSGLKQDKLMHASQAADSEVSSSTARLRLQQFKHYMDWLNRHFHETAHQDSDASVRHLSLIRAIDKELRSMKDQNNVTQDPFQSVIPDEIFMKLIACINPMSDENPFKGARIRNQLLLTLLRETGMRRGALIKTKLSDVVTDHNNPRIKITRTPNDPSDPRNNRPAQKTRAYAVPISQPTMKCLKLYVESIRAGIPGADQHDFVFVSEKGNSAGQPLSITGFNYLFDVLSKYLRFKLRAHMLRHKMLEILDEEAEKQGIPPDVIKDMAVATLSWSENTKMFAHYNEKRLAQKAAELSLGRQAEQFNPKESAND
ncbi:site-specific integrase [Photobacterium sp. BZF1]|uniref:tyrosine-type recombinase/integrase n=1 Tax=Photobacterium sp. BZF1 TaxID=1904457 RepID=UPI0016534577|nr:site-specific integrase [Photobacterium sp. BZF1]